MTLEGYRLSIINELRIFNCEDVDARNDEYLFLLRTLDTVDIPDELKSKMSWVFTDENMFVYNKYLKLLEIIQDFQQKEIKEE